MNQVVEGINSCKFCLVTEMTDRAVDGFSPEEGERNHHTGNCLSSLLFFERSGGFGGGGSFHRGPLVALV